MTYPGRIQNGMVVFDDSVSLPDGTPVMVNVRETVGEQSPKEIPTLFERLEPFIGQVHGLPADASANLDHYLYGVPKQP